MLCSLIILLVTRFSFLTAPSILRALKVSFSLRCFPLRLYFTSYDGSSSAIRFGNSFLSSAKEAPSEAKIGLKPDLIRLLMIGIQRVACPKPQFNGATNMFFGVVNASNYFVIQSNRNFLLNDYSLLLSKNQNI